MSAENKAPVGMQIEKKMNGKINREVKGTILNVAHQELLKKKTLNI